MAYPRASAVAEIGWSQPENRNWKDYLKRLQIQVLSDGDIIKLIVHFTINYHDVVLKVAGNMERKKGGI